MDQETQMTYDPFDPFSEANDLDATVAQLTAEVADLKQTSGELCESCGWRFYIPGRGCLNCEKG